VSIEGMMRIARPRLVSVSMLLVLSSVLAILGGSAIGQTIDSPAAQRDETLRRYKLDPGSSLDSRIQSAVLPEIPKRFERSGTVLTVHVLTSDEREKVTAALASLPPVHRKIVAEHLRSITFLEDLSVSAVTWTINYGEPYPVYDIVIRAAVLHQTASEWLTDKERSVFSAADSPLTVSIEAGDRDAFGFLLLHEATHAADFTLFITNPSPKEFESGILNPRPFITGVWSGTVPALAYRYPLRDQIRYYTSDRKLPIDQAEAAYRSLRQTPFVSLYGGLNSGDDLSEYLAVYHWTNVLKQPYRVVIRNEGKAIFEYEPMESDLVRSRAGQMKQFYEVGNN